MSCKAINPKTQKPYTKHKFVTDVRVSTYFADRHPASYSLTVTCEREGCDYRSYGGY